MRPSTRAATPANIGAKHAAARIGAPFDAALNISAAQHKSAPPPTNLEALRDRIHALQERIRAIQAGTRQDAPETTDALETALDALEAHGLSRRNFQSRLNLFDLLSSMAGQPKIADAERLAWAERALHAFSTGDTEAIRVWTRSDTRLADVRRYIETAEAAPLRDRIQAVACDLDDHHRLMSESEIAGGAAYVATGAEKARSAADRMADAAAARLAAAASPDTAAEPPHPVEDPPVDRRLSP